MKNGKNIRGALSYNEAKVREGKAELIMAARFGCEINDLNFSQKLKRFTQLNEKCITSEFTCVHVSLNFSPDEKLDTEKMQLIARDYMQLIGFEKQPFLVYRHDDTNHQHLHIVTTPVKANGRAIYLHNLVARKSEPARKSLEVIYGLVKAQGRGQDVVLPVISTDSTITTSINKVIYGKAQTKAAISQIVRTVADTYRFTSPDEYNLILQQFNVTADPGQQGTRMHKHGGLQYFITNAKGEKISVPVKASSIYTNPGLKTLDRKFARNRIQKQAKLQFTQSAVQFAIKHSQTRAELISLLGHKKIGLTYYGGQAFFIDNRNKTVYSLFELGFSQNALDKPGSIALMDPVNITASLNVLQNLFGNQYTGPEIDKAFFKKKRKKKRHN